MFNIFVQTLTASTHFITYSPTPTELWLSEASVKQGKLGMLQMSPEQGPVS